MKPFLGPIIDIFEGMLMHKPYVSALGYDESSMSIPMDNFAPEVSLISSHKMPKHFTFGNEA